MVRTFLFMLQYYLDRGGFRLRHHALVDFTPVYGFKEGLNVVGAFGAVVEHKGVFEDIHDEERDTAGQVSGVVLVDPTVEVAVAHWIVV